MTAASSSPGSIPPSARLSLPPGQARLLHLHAGDELFTAQGSLRVIEPASHLHRVLRSGRGHALARAGWVRLEAGAQPVQVLVRSRSAEAPHGPRDALPACDPRGGRSSAWRVWRFVQGLAAVLANSACQRQRMPS